MEPSLGADLGEAVGQLLQLEPVGVHVVPVVAVVPVPLPAAALPVLPVLGGGRGGRRLALEPGCQRGRDPVGAVLGYPRAGLNSFSLPFPCYVPEKSLSLLTVYLRLSTA